MVESILLFKIGFEVVLLKINRKGQILKYPSDIYLRIRIQKRFLI
ncbi:hypothetical protein MTsPCn5_25630 [Croceitalea sp. MTPC5]|nr:hypothetical protein MTsPCn5_25630 [Croceitalea sp. MTPC5]